MLNVYISVKICGNAMSQLVKLDDELQVPDYDIHTAVKMGLCVSEE